MSDASKPPSDLDARDLEQIEKRGLSREEVERQLALLRSPPPALRLDRACRTGDGIRVLGEKDAEAVLGAHAEAAAEGRFTSFVPASGAASRMFKSLFAAREIPGGPTRRALEERAAKNDADARDALRVADSIHRFAFAAVLTKSLAARGLELDRCLANGELAPILDAILDAGGLDYAATPKGLILFHRYPDAPRTAFEEHLVEAAALVRDREGKVRLHLTVSPEHHASFAHELEAARQRLEGRLGIHLEVGFSFQKPSTDTVAVGLDGAAMRDASGSLLFRPGGHGALLENLNDLDADLVYVKNIDNIVPDHLRAPILRWRRLLGGCLAMLQRQIFAVLRELDAGPPSAATIARGFDLLERELGITRPPALSGSDLAAQTTHLRSVLERPVRVCGMVRNEGDPGGAPFWVRERDGQTSAQIVETAQIDRGSEEQRAIHAGATHFNPADMVLGLRDHRGRRFDLRRFVDQDAVFIAEKSSGGRDLRALEHPGLWNGGMARWTTLFIEAPQDVFHPVKTLVDLLDPAHQPADAESR